MGNTVAAGAVVVPSGIRCVPAVAAGIVVAEVVGSVVAVSVDAMLADIDEDDKTVAASNKKKHKEIANKATRSIQICKDMGIADAGATGHFLQLGAPAINIKRASNPISISQLDGKELVSTHE